jgi:ubiquinone/menaquinone biosynthesis C-methylase UbiE
MTPESTPSENAAAVRRFSRSAATYEGVAEVQAWLASALSDRIPERAPKAVLECGCGTGLLTRILAERWPDCAYAATDPAPGMLETARQKCPAPNLRFAEADADHAEGPADWVVSSSALQWSEALDRTLAHLWRQVNPGGGLAFSLMLDGTLREIHEERDRLFPGAAPARRLPEFDRVCGMRPGDAEVVVEEFLVRVLHYPRPREMWVALHGAGVTRGPFAPRPALTPAQLSRLSAALRDRHANLGAIPLTYHMACLVWRKPAAVDFPSKKG